MHGCFGDRGSGNPAVIGKINRRIVRLAPPPRRHLMPDEDDHRHQETSADNQRRHQYRQVLQHACPLPAVFARWLRFAVPARRSVSFGRERPPGPGSTLFLTQHGDAERGYRASGSQPPAGRQREQRSRGAGRIPALSHPALSHPAADGRQEAPGQPADPPPPSGRRHDRCPQGARQALATATVRQVSRCVPAEDPGSVRPVGPRCHRRPGTRSLRSAASVRAAGDSLLGGRPEAIGARPARGRDTRGTPAPDRRRRASGPRLFACG